MPLPGSSTEVNLGALTTRVPDLNADKAHAVNENMEILCFRGAPNGGAPCMCLDCRSLGEPVVNIYCLINDLLVEWCLPARAQFQMI